MFSSNGHLFVEFDFFTGKTTALRPLAEFPAPAVPVEDELCRCQLLRVGLDPPVAIMKIQFWVLSIISIFNCE